VHRALAEELEPRHRVGAEDRHGDRDHHGPQAQQRRVDEEADEAQSAVVRRLEDALVRVGRELVEPDQDLPRRLDDLRDLAHREQDHVVEGEQRDEHEERDPQRSQHAQRRDLDVVARPAFASHVSRSLSPKNLR
jgi:hypothetical protein